MKPLALLFVAALFLSGCATTQPTPNPAPPVTSALPPSGKTQIVFFNSTNRMLWGPGTGRIEIRINGGPADYLRQRKYVQVFLTPGSYKLELSHFDIFTFNDTYPLEVGTKPMYIEVFNSPVKTNFEIHSDLPSDFAEDYASERS